MVVGDKRKVTPPMPARASDPNVIIHVTMTIVSKRLCGWPTSVTWTELRNMPKHTHATVRHAIRSGATKRSCTLSCSVLEMQKAHRHQVRHSAPRRGSAWLMTAVATDTSSWSKGMILRYPCEQNNQESCLQLEPCANDTPRMESWHAASWRTPPQARGTASRKVGRFQRPSASSTV